MNILGINTFSHDTSAALVQNGEVVAFVEEERFLRKKHTYEYPVNSIKYCLNTGGLKDINELDYVCFSYIPTLDLRRGFIDFLKRPYTILRFGGQVMFDHQLNQKIKQIRSKHGYKGKIALVGHHRAHAASSFLLSDFSESAIFSIDRGGDYISTMMGVGRGNDIKVIREIKNPHSLGSVYTCITKYLGFTPNSGEGKVMGLAPYGRPTYYEDFKDLVFFDNGNFQVNLSYFTYHYKGGYGASNKFLKKFGPPRQKESQMSEHYEDIAWALQKITEDCAVHLCNWLYEQTKLDNLCIAGGIGLNSVMNAQILMNTPFKDVFIQAAANDAGGAVGSAIYMWNKLNQPKKHIALNHVYLGPEYSEGEIEEALGAFHVKKSKVENVTKEAAKKIADGKIVGWFQGRMEAGPRALGNRSILADPRDPKMKDIINARVKFREGFRPFAPSVLQEYAAEYFEPYYPEHFMLMVLPIKEEKREVIPSVNHVDNTGRIQTVSKDINPLYWDLINEFYKLTKVPVVLNTSFNVRGEPIVCTPKEAINCFIKADIDYLFIGNWMLEK
ncbi:MAG: carbamoyl transferase [Actinobacteria bacterium]|nr:MAG: carbamoyl transferase [Actinomycetota bacterium]